MKIKLFYRLSLTLYFLIFLAPILVSAEPKGVAQRVDLLTEQITELSNRFILIQEENEMLNRMISRLNNKLNELTTSNMLLSEKLLCIDTLPSGDILIIDCDVKLPKLIVEGGIETEAIQDINDSGLNISSDEFIQLDTLNTIVNSHSTIINSTDTTLIESAEKIALKSGKGLIMIKKNGDIAIEGKDIQIKASGNLTLKGSSITQN